MRTASICAFLSVGVAIRIEQAALRGQQRARAIDLDRSTLEHDAGAIQGQAAEGFRHPRRHRVIEIERWIFPAPSVVIEIEHCHAGIGVARQENRPVIAAPRLVRGNAVEAHMRESPRQRGQMLAHPRFVFLVGNVDAYRFALAERADHFDQCRHSACVSAAGERDAFRARPGQPGRGMRLPFRGHAVAEGGGGIAAGGTAALGHSHEGRNLS